MKQIRELAHILWYLAIPGLAAWGIGNGVKILGAPEGTFQDLLPWAGGPIGGAVLMTVFRGLPGLIPSGGASSSVAPSNATSTAADSSLLALTAAYSAMATNPATTEEDLDKAAQLLKQWRALRKAAKA